ncbi:MULTISPECIES: hypothetical protein [unclassified Dietzia]|uniref:hypothetical protein n=1 Tax=unclassified Dietzia TaxID=2617939 RepID=UPI000D227350|nr:MULTISPECIES: hypothetical protein [unclassified Dietzia]AVZ38449.1 hypothetical protein CT688_02055 [Dietzia sp. JS16-p6b]QGW23487.1 hypothetical protein GJR88_00668 [Dietzia sp. DQ12-45-1b]
MTQRDSVFDRWSDRVMNLDSPVYGDERERTVFMEASSFGLTIGLYAGLAGAVVSAAFGLILLPVVLLALTILPAAATQWYAWRRGVHLNALVERSGARSAMVTMVGGCALVALVFAAMTVTVFAGQPLLPTPSVTLTPGQGPLGGAAQGAVIGGMIGAVAGMIGSVVSYRKARRGT